MCGQAECLQTKSLGQVRSREQCGQCRTAERTHHDSTAFGSNFEIPGFAGGYLSNSLVNASSSDHNHRTVRHILWTILSKAQLIGYCADRAKKIFGH